jgi:hypothetical protein
MDLSKSPANSISSGSLVGESGGGKIIIFMAIGIGYQRSAVRELSAGKSMLTEEAKRELTQRMEEFLPGAGLSFLIAQGADLVAAELAANR